MKDVSTAKKWDISLDNVQKIKLAEDLTVTKEEAEINMREEEMTAMTDMIGKYQLI